MNRRLLVLACVALVARLVFCFVVFPRIASRTTVGLQPYFDSYREIASSLVTGHGYRLRPDGPPALHRPPGYTLLIALCDPVDPDRCHIVFKLLHAILGALAAIATFFAARAWNASERGAAFAGYVVALWPFLVWETKVTVPENLLVLLVPLAFWGFKRNVWVAALATAWAALTHGLYPLLAIAGLVSVRRRIIYLAIVLAPLALWTARNASHGFPGLATGFGYHYFRGLYDYQKLDLRDHDVEERDYVSTMTSRAGLGTMTSNDARSDPRVNRWLDQQAKAHLLAHPGFTMVKTLTNMPQIWTRQQSPMRSAVTAILLAPLFVMAVIGLRRDPQLWPLAAFMLLITTAAAVICSDAAPMRYALPLMPLLAILAGRALH